MKSYVPYFVGGAIGIILLIIVYYFVQYHKQSTLNQSDSQVINKEGIKIDTVQAGSYKIEIKQDNEVQIKQQDEIIEEKIKSFNDRLGDMYLSIGIIITLVLAIVVGVYFKTETEVAKHMQKNFGQYKSEIETMNGEAQKYLNEIKSKAALVAQVSINRESTQSDNPGQNNAQPSPPVE